MVGVQEGAMSKDLLIDLVIRYGFQVLGALVILGAGAMIAGWLGRVTDVRLLNGARSA
jgi:Mechanosensitive ion channel, conserved TM helix